MKYSVDISRTKCQIYTFEVNAKDEDEAIQKAYQEAYDMNWNHLGSSSAEYVVECVDGMGDE